MKVYDISQELFSAKIYPGDPLPEKKLIKSMAKGDDCQLSEVRCCCHTGTHIDAPCHFFPDGKDTESMCLNKCVGPCKVITATGCLTAEQITGNKAERLLVRGDICVTVEAAREIVKSGIVLFGTEVYTVGSPEESETVHTILLENEVAIVEGLCLDSVKDGQYFLSALPIKMKGVDGSPVRAVLLDF